MKSSEFVQIQDFFPDTLCGAFSESPSITMQKSVTSKDKLQNTVFSCIINFHTCRAETLCRQDANSFQIELGLAALQGKLQIIFYLWEEAAAAHTRSVHALAKKFILQIPRP